MLLYLSERGRERERESTIMNAPVSMTKRIDIGLRNLLNSSIMSTIAGK